MTRAPSGWGIAGEIEDVFDAPRKDARRSHHARSPRQSAGGQRVMHMRFALWVAAVEAESGQTPKAGAACDHLGINYETARRLLADWKQLKEETR